MHVHWFGSSFEIPLILGILSIVAITAVALIFAYYAFKDSSKTIYACGECGCRFRVKRSKLFFTAHVNEDQYLKCPRCKKKSMCSPSYDQSKEPDIDETMF